MRSYVKNDNGKQWLWAVLYGLGLWVVMVVGAIFPALARIRILPLGETIDVAIGPLHLLHIYKTANSDGFVLGVQAKIGLFLLLVLCLMVEVVFNWWMRRSYKN